MVGIAGEPVIVTRKTFLGAFGGSFESAGEDLAQELTGETGMRVAEVLAQFDSVAFELSAHEGVDGVMVAPQDRLTAIYQSYLATHAPDIGTLTPVPAGGYEATFDNLDPTWLRVAVPWVKHHLEIGRHPWADTPGPVEQIENNCRVAVLGDWGTGMYGAPECAARIEEDGDFALLL